MEVAILVPLGAFAMVVFLSYIESRNASARLEALTRERVAAIEKGVPLPVREVEIPELPQRAGHPLKSTLPVLATGIALWAGLAPDHRVWGMVVTALGIAGLVHWFVAGKDEWKRQQDLEEEMHRAYVQYLRALATAAASGDAATV